MFYLALVLVIKFSFVDLIMNKLIKLLLLHNIECKIEDGKLMALEHYCFEGKAYSDWVELKPERNVVLAWLGY